MVKNIQLTVGGKNVTSEDCPLRWSSNTVDYITATFALDDEWKSCDLVRAVWVAPQAQIVTVLDANDTCVVPHEVLSKIGKVYVNLYGIVYEEGDEFTRITTYPYNAIRIDGDAKIEGSETAPITPSQFEQFVEAVKSETEKVTGMTATAETLPAGEDATASYSDGVLSFGIPQGEQGIQGVQGLPGERGETGAAGNGIESVTKTGTVGLVDTYTILFTDGSSSTFTVTNGQDGSADIHWGDVQGSIANQTDLQNALNAKQNKLTAGENITIDENNVISSTGGGGDVTVDDALSSTSTNPVQNKVITSALNTKANTSSLASVATSGNYNDLSNKPTIPTVPTNVSAFTNDAGYITSVPSEYVTETELNTALSGKANTADLATVATSGRYEDLTNKPTIPEVMVVKFSGNDTDGYTADHTYQEIRTCSESGGVVLGYHSTSWYYLSMVASNAVALTQIYHSYILNKNSVNSYAFKITSANVVTHYHAKLQATDSLVTEITSANTNGQYPSAKAVYDFVTTTETDTTYTLSMSGNVITLTPSSGTASSITLPVSETEWGDITGTLANQTDLQTALNAKQNTLTAGDNITIENNVISASGGGGGKSVADVTLLETITVSEDDTQFVYADLDWSNLEYVVVVVSVGADRGNYYFGVENNYDYLLEGFNYGGATSINYKNCVIHKLSEKYAHIYADITGADKLFRYNAGNNNNRTSGYCFHRGNSWSGIKVYASKKFQTGDVIEIYGV